MPACHRSCSPAIYPDASGGDWGSYFTKIRMKTISDRKAYQQNRFIFRKRLFLCR